MAASCGVVTSRSQYKGKGWLRAGTHSNSQNLGTRKLPLILYTTTCATQLHLRLVSKQGISQPEDVLCMRSRNTSIHVPLTTCASPSHMIRQATVPYRHKSPRTIPNQTTASLKPSGIQTLRSVLCFDPCTSTIPMTYAGGFTVESLSCLLSQEAVLSSTDYGIPMRERSIDFFFVNIRLDFKGLFQILKETCWSEYQDTE